MNVIGTNDVNAGNLIFAYGGNNSIIFGSFLPLDLPNLLGWYSSDYGVYNAPGVLATDGQTVRTWQNKVNNGIDLNQGGASMQPIYSNGAIQFLQNAMSGINPYALNAPLTYYVATQTILSGGNPSVPGSIIDQETSNNVKYKFGVNTGSFLAGQSANQNYTSNFLKLTDPKNVIYASFSGTAGSNGQIILGKNNSYETFSQVFGTNNDRVFVVGSNSATVSSVTLKGSIYEILIYTGLHTENEKNQVLTYLSNKWGVTF